MSSKTPNSCHKNSNMFLNKERLISSKDYRPFLKHVSSQANSPSRQDRSTKRLQLANGFSINIPTLASLSARNHLLNSKLQYF